MGPRPVYFQHIQKTGGTSITDTLRLFFREERCLRIDSHLAGDRDIAEALADLRDRDLVTGHADILSSAPADALTFTVLRDPFSRLLSARRQAMQAGEENLAAAPRALGEAVVAFRSLPFAQVLGRVFERPRLVSSFWNHQTLALGVWPLISATSRLRGASSYLHSCLDVHFASGEALRAWLELNKGEILNRATKTLRELKYVGLMEDLQTSACEIFARIGLPEPGQLVVRNARDPFADEGDPETRRAAEDFLTLDYEIYELGKELYARQQRVARGMPADYVRRRLNHEQTTVAPSREPPAGHGWYPAHLRGDGSWARWTGPELESRYSLAAPPGAYRMRMDVYGAVSGRSLEEAEFLIDGRRLQTTLAIQPDGVYSVSADFFRESDDRFDILMRFPDVGQPYGLEVKQFVFEPLGGALRESD